MSVGTRAHDLKGLLELIDGGTAAQQGLQALDEFGGPFGEIDKGAFTDVIPLAKGLAEQDGRGGVSIGYAFDIHG
jgi:hypothetical protein